MPERKIQVGIIGIGRYALKRHVPDLRNTGRAEVMAISRRTEEALTAAREMIGVGHAFTDWRDLLDVPGLDAVVVATAHHVHTEPTLAAIARGLPVLVEKPLALNSADAWSMVKAAEESGTLLSVGYNRRSSGVWKSTQEALASGKIGTIRHVNIVFAHNVRTIWSDERIPDDIVQSMPKGFFGDGRWEGNWRRNPREMGGGPFADSGSHIVDLGLWLGGAPPVSVSALMENAGLSVEQIVSVQARLANEVLLSLSVADGIQAPGGHITVLGDKGMLTAGWQAWGGPEEVWMHREDGAQQLAVEHDDSNAAADFVDSILDGTARGASGRDGAHAVALTEAAYASAAERRLIEVSPLA